MGLFNRPPKRRTNAASRRAMDFTPRSTRRRRVFRRATTGRNPRACCLCSHLSPQNLPSSVPLCGANSGLLFSPISSQPMLEVLVAFKPEAETPLPTPPFFCSDRMLKLCLDLRGFYLKSGQFLGTRHDFMPKVFLKKLG